MKKLLCVLLAMTMLVGSLFIFCSCDEKDKKKDKETTDEVKEVAVPDPPKGYSLYEDEYVAFVYPTGWTERDMPNGIGGSMFQDLLTGNNVSFAVEVKSDLYKTMTVETFNSMIKPSLDAQNMSVSNVKIEQVKNKLGFEITKISYSATGKGVTVKQVIFVIPSGSYNYAIYVTEAKKVDGLLDTVFESLVAKK